MCFVFTETGYYDFYELSNVFHAVLSLKCSRWVLFLYSDQNGLLKANITTMQSRRQNLFSIKFADIKDFPDKTIAPPPLIRLIFTKKTIHPTFFT